MSRHGRSEGQWPRTVNAIDDLSEPLDRLRAALDAACVVGAWDWDHVRGVVVYDHGAAQLLTGEASYAERECRGLAAIAAVHPADQDWLIEHMKQAVRTGGLVLAEYRVITPEGDTRWLLSRGRTYNAPSGQPVRSRGVVIDITELRGDGERYLVHGISTSDDPVERAAELVLEARRVLGRDAAGEVRAAMDLLLFSLGRALARTGGWQ